MMPEDFKEYKRAHITMIDGNNLNVWEHRMFLTLQEYGAWSVVHGKRNSEISSGLQLGSR